MPQLTACPTCAERLEPEDKFCGNCGAAVDQAETRSPAPAAPAIPAPPAKAPAVPAADYGLAPPVAPPAPAPHVPPQPERPPAAERPARAGIADPREEMLHSEREPRETLVVPVLEDDEDTAENAVCVACGEGLVDPDGYCQRCGHAQPHERDHIERELGSVAAATDRGLRHHRNEDAFAVAEAAAPDGRSSVIAVVCDGVSSASRPDEASEAAAREAKAHLTASLSGGAEPRQAMHEALLSAAAAVNALSPPEAAEDPHHNAPACTCVSAIITGDVLTVGWIGDSRAYWIPDDRAGQAPARLTEDDSWAARMVEAGLMSEQEAYADARAHAITGWLGADVEELDPHTASFRLELPGVVIVCTDGLWNYAESAEQLAAVVPADARTDPMGCARTLVGVALDGGGHDNVTVAVLPFPTPGPGAGSV